MFLLILAGGTMVYLFFRDYLHRELDHALFDKLRFLRASCVQREGEVVFELSEHVWGRVQDEHDPEFFQMWDATGHTLHRSWNSSGMDLPNLGVGSKAPVYADLLLPSGFRGRVAGETFVPKQEEGDESATTVSIAVAHDTKRITAGLTRLARFIGMAGFGSGAVVLAAAFTIVRRNLRPLGELSDQIAEIPVGAEQARFALRRAPSELNPVVERLNALMDRVDAALENERQFTANAAHELRNPLAGIRSQLELALSKARSPKEYREALAGVLAVEKRLQSMVDNLMLLTRLQAGQNEVVTSPVWLSDLLRRNWKPFYERAEERKLKVALDCDAVMEPVFSSPELLGIVLRNLFDNAVTYTEPGGRIEIRADRNANGVTFTVANTNPGLRDDELPKMFGRFWRASKAREGDHLHAGIGLTLTEKVVAALGGEIVTRLGSNGMLEIGVRLPAGNA